MDCDEGAVTRVRERASPPPVLSFVPETGGEVNWSMQAVVGVQFP